MTDATPRQPEEEFVDLAHEAEAYAHADFSEVNDSFVGRLAELVSDEEALAIDLGTGPADIPVRLARVRVGWKIVAVDASPTMLSFAEERIADEDLADRIELALADAKKTSFDEGTFDVVFSNSILHHLTDIPAFWKEVVRIAKPSAFVFIRDLIRPATPREAQAIVNRNAASESPTLQEEYYRSLLSSWTPQEVRGHLDAAGLETLAVESIIADHLDVYGRLPG